ncbi:MAG: type II toxin-antitoxin system RelE/ParE family toxin [Rhizobiaceae bacterium]
MTVEVVWLDAAEEDLQDTYRYISAENPLAAVRYLEDIVLATMRLADFPETARRYNSRYRVLSVRNHLVFYSFDPPGKEVLIAAVVDGRRDVAALMGQEE